MFGASTPARHQLRRVGAARRIIREVLAGMHAVQPVLFWLTVAFGVGARFAVLGQFVVVLHALLNALRAELTFTWMAIYAAVILVASGVRLLRLRLQRIYVTRLCRQATASFRDDARQRRLYRSFKGSAYGKTTRAFSIVEGVLFTIAAGLGLLFVSVWLAVLLLIMGAGFLLLLIFADMYRAHHTRHRRFAQNLRPMVSLIRTDMVFNLGLLACAWVIQARGDIQINGVLAVALVFLIRYQVIYIRELQRSVVYLLEMASKQDVFITYFQGRARG